MKMGPNLDTVAGTVYVGTHPGEVQRPLWIRVEDGLFPTGMCAYAAATGERLTGR